MRTFACGVWHLSATVHKELIVPAPRRYSLEMAIVLKPAGQEPKVEEAVDAMFSVRR